MIGERIQAIRGKRSREAFAAELGIHPQTLARYEKGERLPDSSVLENLSKKCGVSPMWLLLGEGQIFDLSKMTTEPFRAGVSRAGDPLNKFVPRQQKSDIEDASSHHLNVELLFACIEAVEEILNATDRVMDAAKKAELIAAIYDLYDDTEKEIDKSRVLRLVNSTL